MTVVKVKDSNLVNGVLTLTPDSVIYHDKFIECTFNGFNVDCLNLATYGANCFNCRYLGAPSNKTVLNCKLEGIESILVTINH